MEAISNQVFGRYTLKRRLAVGGMSELFLATLRGESGFEKTVVVKKILPHLCNDPIFIKMFVDEAILDARLAHPNIVDIHDFGSISGVYYIAMEYIEGVDLHTLLKRCQAAGRPLRAAQVCAIGEGIARGLGYTHDLCDASGEPLHIVHRDVSPQNVMISLTGAPKVMDFGIAKAAARVSQTATGTIKGKLAYMAPEQAAGHCVDKLSDQFSVGAILYEALSGDRLYTATTDVSLLRSVLACKIRPLSEACAQAGRRIDSRLEGIVMRALCRNPSHRYPNLQAMEAELLAYRFALGADGIVDLAAMMRGLVAQDVLSACDATPDWSYAQAPKSGPHGTRPLNIGKPSQTIANTCTPTEPFAPAQRHSAAGPKRGSDPSRRVWKPPARAVAPTASLPPATLRRLRFARHLAAGIALLAVLTLPLLARLNQALPQSILQALRQHVGRPAAELLPAAAAEALPPSALDASHPGHLSLRCDGPDVEVFLGDSSLGTTPLAEQTVPSGDLNLRLAAPHGAAGATRAYRIFVPASGSAHGLISSR